MDSMKKRMTIRKYSDLRIDDVLLEELISIACKSSNTGNMQAYSIIVTKDNDIKKQLAPYHFNQSQVLDAPVVLTFCADLKRISRWCEINNAKHGFDNIQAFTFAAIDAIILAQTFCIAAEEKGLGICYLGTTTYNPLEIADLLKLPELVMPVTTVTLGYPAKDSGAKESDRLQTKSIIHYEYYKEISNPEIADIYDEKEKLEENKRFVEINNKNNLAQVYSEIRYKKEDNEFFSKKLIEALHKQGFLK
jgi:nitroreductase